MRPDFWFLDAKTCLKYGLSSVQILSLSGFRASGFQTLTVKEKDIVSEKGKYINREGKKNRVRIRTKAA